jgi:hypothetical protein
MNLEELEQHVLAEARGELTLTPARREQHEARLLGALAACGATGSASFWRGFGLPGIALGLLVGAGFGFAAGRTTRATSAPPPAGMAADVVAAAPRAEPASPERAAAALPPEPSASLTPPHAVVTPERRPSASRAATPRPVRQESSSLAAELALLQRARTALSHDNPRLALGIVAELDERFPNGLLQEERSATRLLASCALGEPSDIKGLLRTFAERYPESVYRARAEAACASRNVAIPVTGSPPPEHQGEETEVGR